MPPGRILAFAVAVTLVATACSTSTGSGSDPAADGAAEVAQTSEPSTTARRSSSAVGDSEPSTAATTGPPSTTPATTSTAPSTSTTSTAPSTSTTSTTSTTTTTTIVTAETLGVYDPACVMVIEPGDSLGLIASRFDDQTVTAASLRVENDIVDGDVIFAGNPLDVCVDNGLNDITGEQRVEPNEAIAAAANRDAVIAQQEKLNALFAGTGIRELLVDGISGPVTRQRLCAARLSLGLPVTRDSMEPGSDEEGILMAAESLPIPFTSALNSDRWVLVDRTCQMMWAGQGTSELAFVFPASTGEEGWETRDQDRSRAFRYDPAAQNDGWHNSSKFPVAIDNPLNGNMFKPVYFDGGQAIHGSNNVPTTPQSKGCVRLKVEDQNALVGWLGLQDLTTPSWSPSRIGVTVNVQGEYLPD